MIYWIASFFGGFAAFFAHKYFSVAFQDHWRAIFVYRLAPTCEHCKTIFGLKLEDSRTQYPGKTIWDDGYEPHKDPNRPSLLCRMCADLHHEYWDDMWKEYYSGRL